jgi:transposase
VSSTGSERSAALPRIDGRRLSHETSAAVRRLAVQRVARGERPSAVIARYGLCRTTIYRWLRAERSGGIAALTARRHPGTSPRVSASEAVRVRESLLDRTPADHGLPGRLWTRRTVAELVLRRTGIRIGPLTAGRLLRHVGLDRLSAQAFSAENGPQGQACILLAADGRGAFLCARLAGSPNAALLRRKADSLQRKAGRRLALRFVADPERSRAV